VISIEKVVEKVKCFIQEHNLIDRGDRVLLALSGGPDSTAMFHILQSLKDELGYELLTAHLNHQLRGSDADLDEHFVRDLSEKYGIPFYSKKVYVKEIADKSGKSVEDCAREERYRFLKEIARKEGCTRIATGHTAGDQVETFILRLIRGSGLLGLSSISPVREGYIIRPLLSLWRDEVMQYLDANSIPYRIDKSNRDLSIPRNRIRHVFLPFIKELFNRSIDEVIYRTVELLTRDSDYLEKLAEQELDQKETEFGFVFDRDYFLNLPLAVSSRVIRKAVLECGAEYPPTYERIDSVYETIADKAGSATVQLIEDVVFEYSSGKVRIARESVCSFIENKAKLQIPGETGIDEGNAINVEIVDSVDEFKEGLLYCCKNAIKPPVYARHPEEGDRFKPLGMEGHKKVYEYLAERGVPLWERGVAVVLEDEGGIIGVMGHIIDERVRVVEGCGDIVIFRHSKRKVESDGENKI
jgi:tRNA(Ile)-lysidine synthase